MRKSQTTGFIHYYISGSFLHRTCLQCKYTEMYYSYFTFHIQIKLEDGEKENERVVTGGGLRPEIRTRFENENCNDKATKN